MYSVLVSFSFFFFINLFSFCENTGKLVSQHPDEKTSLVSLIDINALPNFHKVTDSLYRGAQPKSKGFKQLPELGIKTVINLRAFHSDQKKIKSTKMSYEEIPMESWNPKEKDVIRFLKITTDHSRAPFFVHCKHGADRTGLMCAVYRIAVCNWSKEDAIKEMTQGGFGFHKRCSNLVSFIRNLNMDEIKKKAGIK